MLNRLSTISLTDVRERAKMQLRLQNTTEHDDLLDVFILEGLRNLNSFYQLDKKCCELPIVDNAAQIPKDFVRFIALTFSDNGDCFRYLYADTAYLESCGCNNDSFYNYLDTFQINKGYIYFRSDNNATTARLAYFGLNTDVDGNMVIYEDFERALSAYACWNFAITYFDMYPPMFAETFRKTWTAQKSWLKGAAQEEDFQRNKREIQNIFKSLLVSNIYNI